MAGNFSNWFQWDNYYAAADYDDEQPVISTMMQLRASTNKIIMS